MAVMIRLVVFPRCVDVFVMRGQLTLGEGSLAASLQLYDFLGKGLALGFEVAVEPL